mgnify:CR=1 FL=1
MRAKEDAKGGIVLVPKETSCEVELILNPVSVSAPVEEASVITLNHAFDFTGPLKVVLAILFSPS